MYGVVLFAALWAAEESPCGDHKPCRPAPVIDGGGYPGYHNHGGWGKPYGGYAWPGYGCPDLWGPRPVVTLEREPLVVPPTVKQRDPNDDDDDVGPAKDKDDDKDAPPPKKKPADKDKKGDKDKDEAVAAPRQAKHGLSLVNLTPARKRYLGYASDTSGVVVSLVSPRSAADDARLRDGMLILSVDGIVVVNAKEAAELIDKGRLGVRLKVLDPLGQTRTVTLGQ